MPESKTQLEYIQSAQDLLRLSSVAPTIKGTITRLLRTLNDGLDPSNAAIFVECASNIYQYAITNEKSLDSDSLSLFKQVTSKQSLRLFSQRARGYDAETLRAILEKDRYGLFSGILLKEPPILQTLQDEGFTHAREQLFAHLKALETDTANLPIHRKSIARLAAACQLKCIHKHQALGDYGILALIRDFFGYHFSSSYDKIGTLNAKPHYLGRQPTIAMLARLAKDPKQPNAAPKKILLISIQAPHEGYGTDGKLKNFFHWFARRSPVVTAENVPKNVRRLPLPVMDHSMGISPQKLTQFLQDIQREVNSGKYDMVYTNCRGGKARSSGITALIKVYCNNTTLAAAFDEIKKGRNGAKRFEKLKSEQADVIIRTYFKSLIAEDADAQKRLTAFTSATPDVIAKHLKWYLENANLTAKDDATATSCHNFWEIVQILAQDKTKFPTVMKALLPSLNEKGLGQLMVAISPDKSQDIDHFTIVKAQILMDAKTTFQTRMSMKPAKKTLVELQAIGEKIFETLVGFFQLKKDETMEIRKEVFLAHPETLQIEKKGVDTQQIELTLGSLMEKSAGTVVSSVAPNAATDVAVRPSEIAASIQEMATTGHIAAEKAAFLMSVSLHRHQLSATDKQQVLDKLQPDDSGLVLLKSGKHNIYRASLDKGTIQLTRLKHHHPALEKIFPDEQGKMISHSLGRIGGSRTISIPTVSRPS